MVKCQKQGQHTHEYLSLHRLLRAAIDEMAPNPEPTPTPTPEVIHEPYYGPAWKLTPQEVVTGLTGKLDAVKMYKDRTGERLMESKTAVERFFMEHNLTFNSMTPRPQY